MPELKPDAMNCSPDASPIRLLVRLVLVCSIVLTQSACLTPKLWSESRERDFSRPAPHPRLALHQAPAGDRVLVSYDELSDNRAAVRRRAFFLHPNLDRLAAGKKPAFVSPAIADSLQPVPVVTGNQVASAPVFAAAERNDSRITFYQGAKSFGPVDLPVYPNRLTDVARIALTPLAIAGDVVIFASFFGFFGLAYGGGSFAAP